MYTIRKVFRFEGSHALSSAYSEECMKVHGHSYTIEVFLKSDTLNKDGMVVDFKFLKERVKHIFDRWDHALAVHKKDHRTALIHMSKLVMPFNPTAENMARNFYENCKAEIPEVSKVRVHETATGWAEYYEHSDVLFF